MISLVQSMDADHPCTPALVLSNRPDAKGLAKAAELGVPTAVVDHTKFGRDRGAFEAALNEVLTAAAPDIICLAGFMRILTPDFTEKWQGKMLNIHPSLLPKYKGLNTHARALAAGDRHHGCTVHWVSEGVDEGGIIAQSELSILETDTTDSLAERVQALEHALYPTALAQALREINPAAD